MSESTHSPCSPKMALVVETKIGDTVATTVDDDNNNNEAKSGDGGGGGNDNDLSGDAEAAAIPTSKLHSSGDHGDTEKSPDRKGIEDVAAEGGASGVAAVPGTTTRSGKSRATQTIRSCWNTFNALASGSKGNLGNILSACDVDVRMVPPSPESTESVGNETDDEETASDAKMTNHVGEEKEEEEANDGTQPEEITPSCSDHALCGAAAATADGTSMPYSAADNEITGVSDSSPSDNSEGDSEVEDLDDNPDSTRPQLSDTDEPDTGEQTAVRMGKFGHYKRCYGGSKSEDDFNELDVDDVNDPDLRRWLEKKFDEKPSEASETDPDEDDCEDAEIADRKGMVDLEDKCVQVSESDFPAPTSRLRQLAQLSNWFAATAVPTLGVISQTSRLIQTDSSYLHEAGDQYRLRAGLDSGEDTADPESQDSTDTIVDDDVDDNDCLQDIPLSAEGDDTDNSSIDGITDEENDTYDDDDDPDEHTEMPEHLEKLLNSLHEIPPVKSEDGSHNMWMVPTRDDNGNCMNVILDDGEVYDIYIFRPRCSVTTVSTQTDEGEFDREIAPREAANAAHVTTQVAAQ